MVLKLGPVGPDLVETALQPVHFPPPESRSSRYAPCFANLIWICVLPMDYRSSLPWQWDIWLIWLASRRLDAPRGTGRALRRRPPGGLRPGPQTERRASVGARRAARTAGYRPAMAPMSSAAPRPAATALGGMTICQLRVVA